MPQDERILLLRAGGTIDSEPYDDPRHPPEFVDTLKGDHSFIMRTVAQLPNSDKVDGFSWGTWNENRFVKDSQLFTPEDITALADIIKADTHRYFILTHGTDAMAKNARSLQEALKDTDKVIAFTGAMVPLSMAKQHPGDAVDALRFTLANITQQSPGVYVVGRDAASKRLGFFDPQKVEKNKPESQASLQFTLNRR